MQLIPFNFDGFGVRVIEQDGEPWFVARDVAEVLGYAKPQNAVAAHCKGALKQGIPSPGGVQDMTIIPERDVYRLIMRSKLLSAERFEEWVVGEVLPSIRKTGSYGQSPIDFSNPDEIIPLLTQYAHDKKRLLAQIEEQKPAVEFYDSGSSPRMRGTPCKQVWPSISRRFIPAHAGNTLPATH
jgi:prophage antirepressor-like protein